MIIEVARLIAEAANKEELDITLHEGYKGREVWYDSAGTAGLVGKRADIIKAVALAAYALATNKATSIEDFVLHLNFRWDSMGLDDIAY